MDAKQRNDAQGLATMKELADYTMRLVLGVEAKNLRLSGARIIVDAPAAAAASSTNSKIVGAWFRKLNGVVQETRANLLEKSNLQVDDALLRMHRRNQSGIAATGSDES